MDSTSPQLAAAALETGPDAMLVVDSDWTIRVANRQVTAILGYASDEVLGRDIECLVPERFRERHIAHRNAYMTQMRVQSIGLDRDLYALRRDGTEVPIEIGLSPIENNGEVLAVVSIRDATYRRSVEAA
ncbi:PAS/PAC sensor signal transduction histidine kinase, partial [mine drainage metagenome]